MKLYKLTLNNFQGIRSLTLDFPGGCSASIYGDNATGKTTVYNALTWLLFDKASTGAKSFTPKTKGADGDLHFLDHSSEGVFVTDDGRQITLKKLYHESYKKKRGSAQEEFTGHTVEYSIDGVPVKEKEFNETVLALCGGDAEKPKMLTMPDYFPEQLSWDARRKILLDVCGDISDDEIIAENSELNELRAFLRKNGATEQYYTIDEYRRVAAARRGEINRQLTEIPARIDEATQALPDVAEANAEQLEADIASLMKKRDGIAAEKAELKAGGAAGASLRTQIAELKAKLAEGRAAHLKEQSGKNADVDAELQLVRREASDVRYRAEELRCEIDRSDRQLERLKTLREQLLAEYQTASEVRWDEGQELCPTCGRPLPAEQIERLRGEFNLRKSKQLEDINRRGRTEASKEKISELIAKRDELKLELGELSEAIKRTDERAAELEDRRLAPIAYETTEEYAALMSQISGLEGKLDDESKCSFEAITALEDKLRAVDEALREKRGGLSRIELAENMQCRISELKRKEKQLGGEFEELEKGLYLCDLFTQKKVSALTERINGKFKSVRFRLFVEQLNGGLKEDCEVMIPRDDGVLVPFAFANNAARINAGLEIINTLAEHWGIQMPVFIDNAESVTHLESTDMQLIRLVVSEADKRLRIEVDE